MDTRKQNPVVITEEDFNRLMPYTAQENPTNYEMSLAHELKRAVVVQNDALPPHCVRINSKVAVLDLETNRVIEITIVLPKHADMRQNKISILTPMAIALIGFRKAEEVQWEVPAGLKRFRILDVVN